MTQMEKKIETPSKTGKVLHGAATYDVLVWLMTLGRERAFREKMLRLAHLEPGESVLDLGCGTGSLAIVAKRHVGPTGTVYGVDASPEMVRIARQRGVQAKQLKMEELDRMEGSFSLRIPVRFWTIRQLAQALQPEFTLTDWQGSGFVYHRLM